MVDAVAFSHVRQGPLEAAGVDPVAKSQTFTAKAHHDVDAFIKACANLELFAPPQSALWVATWIAATKPDAVFVTVERGGRPVFSFGMQIERKGPFKVGKVLGLSHANGNFFPLSAALEPEHDGACMAAAIGAVRAARPDVHALIFERQLSDFRGRKNPVLALPSQPSPNIALSFDLTPGFEAVLDKNSGARKRKRHRYQARKLEAIGAVRRYRARDGQEAVRTIDAFFEAKSAKLRQMGITDVFAPEPVRTFFRMLFATSAETAQPQFVLDALEVDGKIRAVTGSSLSGGRLICDFAGYFEDETSIASAGDFLLFENIKHAAAAGFTIYDLGVGDEPYKRSWCDIETWQRDAFVALTATGAAFGAVERTQSRLKSAIKGNAKLWSLVKRMRGALKRTQD